MATGLYVFCEYVKRLQTLFQQNKVNVLFRETVRLIARNPLSVAIEFYFRKTRHSSNDLADETELTVSKRTSFGHTTLI